MAERGLCESREKAKALIMAGLVFADGERCDKAGTFLDPAADIVLTGRDDEFVSRGGKKLKKAVETFGLDLTGLVCADIGASTGGFTDCMLQNGARKVYAVDVGYGQLAWKLRNDARVVNLERTNFRYITDAEIPEKLDFFSVDVSFISLHIILPAAARVCGEQARGVCLIKPQFEAGRDKVGKHGVVSKKETHVEVIRSVFGYIRDNDFGVKGLTFSPIKGPEGNIEYLVYIARHEADADGVSPEAAVEAAHAALDRGTAH